MAKAAKPVAQELNQAAVQAFQDNIAKSVSALGEMKDYSRRNLEAVTASVTVAAKGAESLGGMAFAFAKKSAEDNIATIRAVASAKDPSQAVELQTAAAKTAMEAYVAEMSRWSDALTGAVRETVRPLNERLLAVADHFQGSR